MKIDGLIFDLDGVITSEENYWEADRLSLWELLTSHKHLGIKGFFNPPVPLPVGRNEDKYRVLSVSSIAGLKNRAVNSNWDITLLAFSACLIQVLQWVEKEEPDAVTRLKDRELDGEFIAALGRELKGRGPSVYSTQEAVEKLLGGSEGIMGHRLLAHLGVFFQQNTFMGEREFSRGCPLWEACRDVFQGWVRGEAFKNQSFTADKTSLIRSTLAELGVIDTNNMGRFRMDLPVLPKDKIMGVFQTLRSAGMSFAVATGRPKDEAFRALRNIGIIHFFDERRIITLEDVDSAEAYLRRSGNQAKLSKPHPYSIVKAIHPDKTPEQLINLAVPDSKHKGYAMIGDAMSDIISAKEAGCTAIGVLSGTGRNTDLEESQRELFLNIGADMVIPTIEELPQLLLD